MIRSRHRLSPIRIGFLALFAAVLCFDLFGPGHRAAHAHPTPAIAPAIVPAPADAATPATE